MFVKLCHSILAVGSLTDDIAPEIVVPPRHTTAVQGDDPAAVLECIANARYVLLLRLGRVAELLSSRFFSAR